MNDNYMNYGNSNNNIDDNINYSLLRTLEFMLLFFVLRIIYVCIIKWKRHIDQRYVSTLVNGVHRVIHTYLYLIWLFMTHTYVCVIIHIKKACSFPHIGSL